jgi:ABC-type branched-subunit amino acid transport system ATPase component
MARMIEATGVVKRFGETIALDGLELSAEEGVILAVLGPNGAGKTTFVRCIATLLEPDAGTLRVFGHDVVREPQAVRSSIGLAGQFAAVEAAMTGRENLEMVARLFGQDRIRVCGRVGSHREPERGGGDGRLAVHHRGAQDAARDRRADGAARLIGLDRVPGGSGEPSPTPPAPAVGT